ncbi:MAG: class I SAM-dependent methyltransferase [Candidatus Hydrogenedentota bacterium]
MTELNDADSWLSSEATSCLTEIGLRPGQTVLDFGCGKGRYSIPAAQVIGEHGKLYAADKNPATLETIHLWASTMGIGHIDTLDTHGKVYTPLKKNSVDAALLHDVLHLIGWKEKAGRTIRKSTYRDRESLLQEMYRILKCNGILSVFCPHLATHTDVTSEYAIIREIMNAGFRLEREMYREIIHDDRLQQSHLCRFSKKCSSAENEEPFAFSYDAPLFQKALRNDGHHFGEVLVLANLVEPGMTVLELGANRGVTTVALARATGLEGQVHAFEPVPEYYAALVQNLQRNRIENTQVHQFAVTDKESVSSYYKHGEGSGIVHAHEAETILVGTTSLDHFVKTEDVGQVDVINMDCEGAELLALQGATNTLQKHAPRIFCEIHHEYLSRIGQSVGDIVTFLHALDFRAMPIRVEALGEHVGFEDCTHIYAAKDEPLPDIKSLFRWRREGI